MKRKLFKSERVKDAEFWRGGTVSGIAIHLPDVNRSVTLSSPLVSHSVKALSERELEETIEILSHKAKVMLKQRNFPQIYDEMLTELKNTLEERYSKRVTNPKKGLSQYSLSAGQLEDMLKERYNFKDVHISSIYVGADKGNIAKLEVGVRHGFLHMSFSGVEEDE